jgi:pimeloyl-ACP methyl ester carboxylesterase
MEGYVHTDDEVTLRSTVHGAVRPVLFVHGWQGAAGQWRPAAEALAGERRAVRCDQRGHGRSHDARSSRTIHRLAYSLAQLLEQLALTDAVLVGHSMGCSVIWAYLELFGAAGLERLVPGSRTRSPAHGSRSSNSTRAARICSALENPTKFNRLLREFVFDAPTPADSRLSPHDDTASIESEGATK